MEEYILRGPPAYKRPRLDSLQSESSFLDARSNMVPFGFFPAQDREADMNMAAMTMSGSLLQNPSAQDFGPLALSDWRSTVGPDTRRGLVVKLTQQLVNSARNAGENSDLRAKWPATAVKIENKIYKTATSRPMYFTIMKEEIFKAGYGSFGMSSQYFPSSSTTSSAAANNLQSVNMQQNYGPNNFGESVSASQSHSQPIAHSASSVNLFSDDNVGGSMRLPVTSSIGSARPPYDGFNGGRPIGPRSMAHDQVSGPGLPLGDPSQFMPNSDQALASNLLHSINPLMAQPLNQFLPSSTIGSQQRFGDSNQGVLSENSSIVNSQMNNRISPKEWHKSMSFNRRNNIIRKMAQMLASIPDPQPGSAESRMHYWISIATNVENETHRIAISQSQYYDWMVKRCQSVAKERANMSQAGMQYYQSRMADLRWIYENLGISHPGSASFTAGGPGSVGNGGGGINMRHESSISSQPPPPSIIPNLMGSSGQPVGLPPPYSFARGHGVPIQPPGHNQLIDRLLQGSVPLSPEMSEVPEVVKQLAHAYKCQERENQENDVMLLCSLPNCRDTKNLLNHITTCQIGVSCCGSTKEIIDHWNRCSLSECPICLPVRQAERNLNSVPATSVSINNQMAPNYMSRRVAAHRSMNLNYPSTATSGLLSNQSQSSSGLNSINLSRDQRPPQRSSMWHSSYNDTWQRPPGIDRLPDINSSMDPGNRRFRYSSYSRNNGNRNDSRRQPYGSYGPWAMAEMFFGENIRGNSSARGSNYIGPMMNSRSIDRLQPYGGGLAPWRTQEIILTENVRPAHRHAPDADELIIIPPEEEATPTDNQTIMAIVKVVKTQGGRLEQKFRCSRRSCNASWPCIHRRLASSHQALQTPIPA